MSTARAVSTRPSHACSGLRGSADVSMHVQLAAGTRHLRISSPTELAPYQGVHTWSEGRPHSSPSELPTFRSPACHPSAYMEYRVRSQAEIAKNKATQEAKQRLHDHEVQEAHRLAEQGRIEELLAASTAGSARDSSRTLVAGQRASSSLCRVGSVLLGSVTADSAVSQV